MTKQNFKNNVLKLELLEKRSKDFNSYVEANMKLCALYKEAMKSPWWGEYLNEFYYNSDNKRCITF